MGKLSTLFLVSGCLNAGLAVVLGAFGAHALKTRLSTEMMAIYQTGIQYHFYHAIGLIMIGVIALYLPQSALLKWSGYTMFLGIILFSGSLYILSLTGIKWLGAITPLGGTAFIASWLMLATAIAKS